MAQHTLRLCYLLCVLDEVRLLLCTWLSSSLHGMIHQGASEKQKNISVTQRQSESSMARKKKMYCEPHGVKVASFMPDMGVGGTTSLPVSPTSLLTV